MQTIRYFAIAILMAFALPALAQSFDQMYERIEEPRPPEGEKIVVSELFLYSCPHCYRFESFIKPWMENLPEDVEFQLVPAVFSQRNMPLAKAFYTAEVLGILDTMHPAIFKAIHDKRERIRSDADVRKLFIANGVSGEDFDKTYNSFSVDSKTRQANAMTIAYGVNAVPAVVVNGTYRVTPNLTGGFDNKLKVIDHLIEKERPTADMAKAE